MIRRSSFRFSERLESSRGAIFIQVAISIFVLSAFGAFVIDYGALWLSRVQAQNAADAGALAGATARAFDEPTAAGQYTNAAATQAATANVVYGQPAFASVDSASACPGFATGGAGDSCVQVGVYVDGTNGSTPVPTYLARLFGATEMKVAATATAQVRFGNSTPCLKPWVVPDRFSGPDWPTKPFKTGTDTYTPPTAGGSTGFGRQDFAVATTVTLYADSTASSTFYQQIDLNQDGGGVGEFLTNITSCEPLSYSISDFVKIYPGLNPKPGWQAAQDTALQTVVDQDPAASSSGGGVVQDSCAPASCPCTTCPNGLNAFLSPRIVTVALADPHDLELKTNPVRIVNIMSMLLLPPDGTGNIRGVIVPTTGLEVASEASVWAGTGGATGNAFIAIPTLVR